MTEKEMSRSVHGVSMAAVSVDSWVASGGTVKFEKTGIGQSLSCSVYCYNQGNFVSATGAATTSGDAFFKAIEQIEKTVGNWWRAQKSEGK